MKVLIINGGIRAAECVKLMCTVLQMEGYQADGAISGQAGLALAREQQPDWAILVTNHIHDMPAHDVVLQLIEIVPELKFVFLSGAQHPRLVGNLLRHGLAAELRPFPFDVRNLLRCFHGESALQKLEDLYTERENRQV